MHLSGLRAESQPDRNVQDNDKLPFSSTPHEPLSRACRLKPARVKENVEGALLKGSLEKVPLLAEGLAVGQAHRLAQAEEMGTETKGKAV